MLRWEEAVQIRTAIREDAAADEGLQTLERAWVDAAVRYAHARAEWWLAPRAERSEMEAHRTRLHDAFIDSCTILSRNLARRGRPTAWRRQLGDDRKDIGDLACFLHCMAGLDGR